MNAQGELLPRFFRVTTTWRAGIREGAMTKGVVRRRTRYLPAHKVGEYVANVADPILGASIARPGTLTSLSVKPCSEADYTRNTHGGY